MSQQPPVMVVCGPTASGKTALALALRGQLKIEVVSADSRQIYQDMDIGTAKPTQEDRAFCPHHLIDVVTPDQDYSAGRFACEAEKAIGGIIPKGFFPVVVGGSGLYLRALTEGLFHAPDIPPEIRISLREELHQTGSPSLHKKLMRLDPASAAKIDPNDGKKICRALEIVQATGIPMSQWHEEAKSKPAFRFFAAYVDVSRKELYQRIDARVLRMVQQGLFEEVEGLLRRGYDGRLNSMNTVGYKEGIAYLQGKISKSKAVEAIQRNTRHYAKRQVTWFNKAQKDFIFSGMNDLERLIESWKKAC